MASRLAPKEQQGHTQSYSADPYWYVDTAATDHLTSELGKLHSHEAYHGSDKATPLMEQLCPSLILVKHLFSLVMPIGVFSFAIFFEFHL
jgi:hypothetical protein